MPGDAWRGYQSPGFFDEMIADQAAAARRDLGPGSTYSVHWARDELAAAAHRGRSGHQVDGHHLHRLFRRRHDRPRLALRHPAAHDPGQRNGDGVREGLAQRVTALNASSPISTASSTSLPTACSRARYWNSRRTSARSASACAARRYLGAYLRLGSGARRRRQVLCARRQPARAVGRVLHGREPAGLQAGVSRAVRAARDPAGGRLPAASCSMRWHALSPRRTDVTPERRGAHAGHLQLGVLRACLAGRPDGRRAGRRARDLFVDDDDCVYARTIFGPQRVDVIYRRVDDLFHRPGSLPRRLHARHAPA